MRGLPRIDAEPRRLGGRGVLGTLGRGGGRGVLRVGLLGILLTALLGLVSLHGHPGRLRARAARSHYPRRPHPGPLTDDEQHAVLHFASRSRRRARVTVAALIVGVLAAQFIADVTTNAELEATASARIEVRGSPQDPAIGGDSALVFLTGVGTNNADDFARFQFRAFQQIVDGRVWSVDYANATLDPVAIARDVSAKAQREGVTRVSLIGLSVGGVLAAQIADELMAKSRLTIELLALESTPDGLDGVRSSQLRSLRIADVVTLIPGVEHSSYLRIALEMALRGADMGFDPRRFFSTLADVTEKVNDGRLPGSWLVVDQVLAISDARLGDRFQSIGNAAADRQRPVVVYLGTAPPGYDTFVDDDLSGTNICRSARLADLRCLELSIPGAVHARPDIAIKSYQSQTAAVAPGVDGWIELARVAALIERFDIPTRVPVR